MKKSVLFLIIGFMCSFPAIAGDIQCGGTVIQVMDYPARCGGNIAFKTDASNNKWICSTSKNGDSMLLTEFVVSKSIYAYLDSQSETITCETLENYNSAKNIIVLK